MNVLGLFGIILLLAFLTESLVEYVFGALADHIPSLTPLKWATMYLAMAVGVLGSFIYKLDLVSMAGEWFNYPIAIHPFGLVLTGLGIGRGANYIHQIMSTYFPNNK